MAPRSAIPTFYYIFFGIYEPVLTISGFVGALMDPKKTHDAQAPWPDKPSEDLPLASRVTVLQLAHVCALIGVINACVLHACKLHIAFSPPLQEKLVRALLWPLLIGDVLHIVVTFWALGDIRWDVRSWTSMIWITLLISLTLFIPRVMWHLGIWRYVHSRDSEPGNRSDTLKDE